MRVCGPINFKTEKSWLMRERGEGGWGLTQSGDDEFIGRFLEC